MHAADSRRSGVKVGPCGNMGDSSLPRVREEQLQPADDGPHELREGVDGIRRLQKRILALLIDTLVPGRDGLLWVPEILDQVFRKR